MFPINQATQPTTISQVRLEDINYRAVRKVQGRTGVQIETFEDLFLKLFGNMPHSSISGKKYVRIANTNYRIAFDDVFALLNEQKVQVKKRSVDGYYIPVGEKMLVELLPISLD